MTPVSHGVIEVNRVLSSKERSHWLFRLLWAVFGVEDSKRGVGETE